MWSKLHSIGLSTKVLNLIENIYEKANVSIKINGKLSPPFQSNKGVRQGCPLSPLLFTIYINDLIPFIHQRIEGIKVCKKEIKGLLFADDMALFSDTAQNMQHTLLALEQYCNRWDLTVNTTKTKIMRYPSSPPSTFLYLNEPLEEVPYYKYLGFYISNFGKLDKGMEMLVASANKAYSALLGHSKRLGASQYQSAATCSLF